MIMNYELQLLKHSNRPEYKQFYNKPHESDWYGTRRRTRPWDNCWFSNKPHIISLTVEEAVNQFPDYMLWCYNNLNIKWSVHTIKLFKAIGTKKSQSKNVLATLTF